MPYAEIAVSGAILRVVAEQTAYPLTPEAMEEINESRFGHAQYDYVVGGNVAVNTQRMNEALKPTLLARIRQIEEQRVYKVLPRIGIVYFILDVLNDLSTGVNHAAGRADAEAKLATLASVTAIKDYADSLRTQVEGGASVDVEAGWPTI